ncbi:hypothetical protein SASPL_100531 [Salvia splendens]|uniref:Uncharacterized protein n=1 Tax=Salvia splendens TaxID=180675 RepID=A0A8X9AB17_SALSN|nr:hypothetical protein SASPL_100531 [Salvia splendens]
MRCRSRVGRSSGAGLVVERDLDLKLGARKGVMLVEPAWNASFLFAGCAWWPRRFDNLLERSHLNHESHDAFTSEALRVHPSMAISRSCLRGRFATFPFALVLRWLLFIMDIVEAIIKMEIQAQQMASSSSGLWKSIKMEILSSLGKRVQQWGKQGKGMLLHSKAHLAIMSLHPSPYFASVDLRQFKRIKRSINSMREHADLRSSIQDDISAATVTGEGRHTWKHISCKTYKLLNVCIMIDDAISQAQATRAVLGSQALKGPCLEMFKMLRFGVLLLVVATDLTMLVGNQTT